MSEDLIERLYIRVRHDGETVGDFTERLLSERRDAAAEIERLRANLASAKEVIAPFSDMAKHHAADAPEWRDHHAVHAMVLIGHLRAAAEWMEKGDE